MRDPLSHVQIKYKLTGAFVGICLFAFGVGGYLISVSAGSALESEINLRIAAESAGLAHELSATLHLMGRRAEDFASDGYIRAQMETLLAVNGLAGNAQGDVVHEHLAAHLARNKFPLISALTDLLLLGPEGNILASVRDADRRIPAGVTRDLLRHDTLWYSSFVESGDGDNRHFAISTPVRNLGGGTRIGTLCFWIDLRRLVGNLSGMDTARATGMLSEHIVTLSDQRGGRFVLTPASGTAPGGHAGNAPGEEADAASFAMRDVASVAAAAPSPAIMREHAIGSYGWRVHVAVDAHRAMLPVSGLQSSFLGAGVLIALVSLILLYFPVRFLIKPLAALGDAARAMTAGDFTIHVDDSGEDEIGDVARSFNLMAAATEERTTRLRNTARQLDEQRKALSIERDLLNTVVHSMDDAVLYFDRDATLIMHNNAAAPLLEYLRDAQLPLAPRRCACGRPGERDCRQCLLDHRMPARDCMLDVGHRVYEVVSSSIASMAGLEGTVLVGRDVTERMRIDEKQAHQDRLAVLGEVSAVMAHELNNPLAAISMFAQMMRSDLRDDATYSEHLDVILRNTESCKRTIRYLLSYGRGEAAGEEETDLHEVLVDVVRFLRPLYEKGNVCFDMEFMNGDAVVRSDETWLRQVFVNLIMNALQALDEEGGRITVRTRWEDNDSAGLLVDIMDNGPGIPLEHQHSIFEPFFTSKPSGKGTGLGLSISRRIITTLGGTLALATSRPGETVFRVAIPRVRTELTLDADVASSGLAGYTSPPGTGAAATPTVVRGRD
ncbi:MAG: ATP-binding protein [Bacteroidia bacterium]|nr:ATP-binding protein [Bacteroidia bacterium]